MFRNVRLVLALSLASFAGVAGAAPVQLITNGGFETGTFAGWTVTDLAGGSGSWYIDDNSGSTPFSANATVGPATGDYYAVSDQVGPGTHVLEQQFTVPVGSTSVVVAFDMFINDWSGQGPIVNVAGLDHNATPNQHARVDIMTALAGAFSTAGGDIVANLVAPGVDAGPDPNPYTAYLFDITAFVTAGMTYRIRFGEVDNQGFFNQGVDNVSILAFVGEVPEPASLALLVVGLAGLGFSRRKRRA